MFAAFTALLCSISMFADVIVLVSKLGKMTLLKYLEMIKALFLQSFLFTSIQMTKAFPGMTRP